MNTLTEDWVRKADEDYISAGREVQVQRDPNYNLVCFLCQQCAEKYLKAYLQENNIPFPRTHELISLMSYCVPLSGDFNSLRVMLRNLTKYAVEFRYPGVDANKRMAQTAYRYAMTVRAFIRTKLGLS